MLCHQGEALLGGVALEEVCHWGWFWGSQMLEPGPVSLSLRAACWSGWRTLSSLSSTMPAACHHASCHNDHGLNLGTLNQLQWNVFFYKSCWSTVSLYKNRTLTKTTENSFIVLNQASSNALLRNSSQHLKRKKKYLKSYILIQVIDLLLTY